MAGLAASGAGRFVPFTLVVGLDLATGLELDVAAGLAKYEEMSLEAMMADRRNMHYVGGGQISGQLDKTTQRQKAEQDQRVKAAGRCRSPVM